MRKIYMIVLIASFLWECDDNYFHDTGLANGVHDCTMWEYLRSDHENWDSTVLLIERAGLVPLFEGKSAEYPEITFFGPTNLSIIQFLLTTTDRAGNRLYHRIADIPAETCERLVKSHIIPGRRIKEDFDYEVRGTLTGGTILQTLTGIELRVFRTKGDYNGIPDIGPEGLGIHALVNGFIAGVASADIVTNTGIVHSLSYSYQMVEL
ncbi:fasciclin domain-containing protein [Sanguibacteroides sp. AM78-02pH3A]|uniref:fasciclin domain-containing protein n=1 Tax=Sanguibacteroides sp. AM78-02pH3A TaxID=3002646 RepID=UPI0022E7AFD9|nr:fasciclin domain-containing protein [Sanguibacteroides sp. AM78-02pH3A]